MINVSDKVKIIETEHNKTIKEGVVISKTSSGATVCSTKFHAPYTEYPEFAEWFPYNSKMLRMIKL